MGSLFRGLMRFLIGVTIGAAAGAAAGYLLAPASGEELKRQLRERLQRTREAGEQAEREQMTTMRRSFQEHVARYEKTSDA